MPRSAVIPSAPILQKENNFGANVHQTDADETRYYNGRPEKKPLPCPECSVCFENLKPPTRIMQCANGHLTCLDCVSKVTIIHCPTCRQKITGRATAMEQYLAILF